MGRWTHEYDEIQYNEMMAVGYAASPAGARVIAAAHNADCDAYEKRIAELEADLDNANAIATWVDGLQTELARVKAESLRVVELPPDYEFMPDYYMISDVLGWSGSDRHGNSCVETPEGYHKFADCKPVRLEHWETEE